MAQTRVEEINTLLSLEGHKLELIELIRNKHFASDMNQASFVSGNFNDDFVRHFLCERTEEEYRAIVSELEVNMSVNSSTKKHRDQTSASYSFQDVSGDVSPPKDEEEKEATEQFERSGIPENNSNVDTTAVNDEMNDVQTDRQEFQPSGPSADETSTQSSASSDGRALASISPDTEDPGSNEEDTLSHSSSSMEPAETSVFSGNESRSRSPDSLSDGAASGEETPGGANHSSATDNSGSAASPVHVAPRRSLNDASQHVNNLQVPQPQFNCHVIGRACQPHHVCIPVCRTCQQPMDIQMVNMVYQQNIILMRDRRTFQQLAGSLMQELDQLKSQIAQFQNELQAMEQNLSESRNKCENVRQIMMYFHKELGERRKKITQLDAENAILKNKCKVSEEAYQLEAILTDYLKEIAAKVKENTPAIERLQSRDADQQLEIQDLTETNEGLLQELETVRENAFKQEEAYAAKEAEIRSRINCEVHKLEQSYQEMQNFAATHRLHFLSAETQIQM